MKAPAPHVHRFKVRDRVCRVGYGDFRKGSVIALCRPGTLPEPAVRVKWDRIGGDVGDEPIPSFSAWYWEHELVRASSPAALLADDAAWGKGGQP